MTEVFLLAAETAWLNRNLKFTTITTSGFKPYLPEYNAHPNSESENFVSSTNKFYNTY